MDTMPNYIMLVTYGFSNTLIKPFYVAGIRDDRVFNDRVFNAAYKYFRKNCIL